MRALGQLSLKRRPCIRPKVDILLKVCCWQLRLWRSHPNGKMHLEGSYSHKSQCLCSESLLCQIEVKKRRRNAKDSGRKQVSCSCKHSITPSPRFSLYTRTHSPVETMTKTMLASKAASIHFLKRTSEKRAIWNIFIAAESLLLKPDHCISLKASRAKWIPAEKSKEDRIWAKSWDFSVLPVPAVG